LHSRNRLFRPGLNYLNYCSLYHFSINSSGEIGFPSNNPKSSRTSSISEGVNSHPTSAIASRNSNNLPLYFSFHFTVRMAGVEPAMFTLRAEIYSLVRHNRQSPHSHFINCFSSSVSLFQGISILSLKVFASSLSPCPNFIK
jgi:hypothetical protein